MELYLNGVPKRKYLDAGTIRCPQCKSATYDKKVYDSLSCKKCGTEMVAVKEYFVHQSGKPEWKS